MNFARATRASSSASLPRCRVLVTNVSYGQAEADEHRYVVTVENGVAWSCTCPHHKHRSARCKHMRASETRDAVLLAASTTDEER